MHIGGIQKLSLIDYPGNLSCVIFTQGCNFRCPYCHNPELVIPREFTSLIDENEVIAFLKHRRQYINAVVLSGGEPTLQQGLITFIQSIKKLDFKIKLDTNGSHPEIIRELINQHLIDFISMDIKTLPRLYKNLTKLVNISDLIEESIELICTSGIAHQFRTTAIKSLISEEILAEIKSMITPESKFTLQRGHIDQYILDKTLPKTDEFSENEIINLKNTFDNNYPITYSYTS